MNGVTLLENLRNDYNNEREYALKFLKVGALPSFIDPTTVIRHDNADVHNIRDINLLTKDLNEPTKDGKIPKIAVSIYEIGNINEYLFNFLCKVLDYFEFINQNINRTFFYKEPKIVSSSTNKIKFVIFNETLYLSFVVSKYDFIELLKGNWHGKFHKFKNIEKILHKPVVQPQTVQPTINTFYRNEFYRNEETDEDEDMEIEPDEDEEQI